MTYSKIYDALWSDVKRKKLSDGAKLLFIYLLSNTHRNVIGLYYLPLEYASADLGWGLETVSKRFTELSVNGIAVYDKDAEVVLVRNFLKYNPLDNLNVEKSAVKAVGEIPKTALLQDFLTVLEGFKERYPNLFQTVSNSVTITVTITKAVTITEDIVHGAKTPYLSDEMAQQVKDPADRAVERLPLNTGDYEVLESAVIEWGQLYPAVDVIAELRKMHGWLSANPKKRKTKAGIAKFINGWLSREQDKGGRANTTTGGGNVFLEMLEGKR